MHTKQFFLGIFLLCAGMVGIALYVQYGMELEPCPLCIFQRIAVMAVGLIALTALLHNPAAVGQKIYSVLTVLAALTGLGISLRHIWIQSQPKPLFPECGGGLNQMLDTMPLGDVLAKVFKGTGECGDTLFSPFGISIPGWTAMAFVFLALLAILAFLRAGRVD